VSDIEGSWFDPAVRKAVNEAARDIEGSWFDPAVRKAVNEAARDRGVSEPFVRGSTDVEESK
jgi:hypothetical protein